MASAFLKKMMTYVPEPPETIFGQDVDDLFPYSTSKFVRIKDARVGILKLLCFLGVILYVFIYQIWYQGAYMELSGVAGAVRFTLQQPTFNTCNPFKRGCKNDFTDMDDLSYCAQSTLDYADGNKYDCQFFESIGAQQILDKSIMVATRITTYEEELVCNNTKSMNCPHIYNITSKSTNYVVEPEEFTILVDHQVLATSINIDITASSSDIQGRLHVRDNKKLCKTYQSSASQDPRGEIKWTSDSSSSSTCYIKPPQTIYNLDYFSLDLLLEASNVHLDDINYGDETYRETGATMLLSITYDNFREWEGQENIHYYYTPRVVAGSDYKYYQSVYDSYRQSRTLLNTHGVFIEAVQGGYIRAFSFNSLLIVLTTSLTLFAIATIITDFVALKLLPDSEDYKNHKYEETEDFSDLRRAKAAKSIKNENGDISMSQVYGTSPAMDQQVTSDSNNIKSSSPLVNDDALVGGTGL